MSNGLQITFSNGLETLSLFYKVYSHAPAIKWFNMVKDAIARKSGLISDTSFVVTEQDKTDLIVEINVLINKINVKHNLTVKHIVNDSDLNKLHQDVAEVNGELWDSINDAIHRYEQFKAQRTDNPRLNAYFQFDENVFIPLEESDYLFFKADRDFGELCMNYTYKGKHWLEVASDDDIEAITDGQLQPEDRIKAQGYMLFRPSHPEPYFKLSHFINWYTKNVDSNISSKLGIGYLLVGKLVMPEIWENRTDWTLMLSKYKILKDVKVIDITDDMIPNILERSKMMGRHIRYE